jgi:hypothetical protein
MFTNFACKVRQMAIKWIGPVLFVFIVATVSYTLYIDFWEGLYFTLSQIVALIILLVCPCVWVVYKNEGGDFSVIIPLAFRIFAGISVYMALLIPVWSCVWAGFIPSHWSIYLGLGLVAGSLSDFFGMKFGVQTKDDLVPHL